MKGTLRAGVVAGAVATLSSLILLIVAAWVDQIDGLGQMAGFALVLMPVGVVVMPFGAFMAGLAGGWLGRTVSTLLGTTFAYVAVFIGTIMVGGGRLSTDAFGIGVYALLLTLVAIGHLTAVALRPRLRPT